jgi:prepilin-type N-terminal cleavage/methylation domain-containing protein
MGFMTTTTRLRSKRDRGFTLVELLIATSLGSVVLLAVLSTFLFLGRSGANISNYAEMEAQARSALEIFAVDARMAKDVTWHSTTALTLRIPASGGDRFYRYSFDPAAQTLTRQLTGPSPGPAQVLITGVQTFDFRAYKINTGEVDFTDLSAAGRVTKQIQLSLSASRTSSTVTSATNTVLSARFILRNKRVTA